MIVLDTHSLLWMDRDDRALGAGSRELLLGAWRTGSIAASAISLWECAMLAQRSRIELPCSIDAWRTDLIEAGLIELPIDGRLAIVAASLEGFHRDPADRFIVATALLRDATLVTADQKILEWTSKLKRQDARA